MLRAKNLKLIAEHIVCDCVRLGQSIINSVLLQAQTSDSPLLHILETQAAQPRAVYRSRQRRIPVGLAAESDRSLSPSSYRALSGGRRPVADAASRIKKSSITALPY